MRLASFYNQTVKFGIERDPRVKKSGIKSYQDTAILYGDPDIEIRKIMVGIDIEVAELLLADRIRQQQGLDLVLAHHPQGSAWAQFYRVMQLQVDMLSRVGLLKKVAQELLNERMREVERRVLANNHMRSVDAARILDMPFMCVHTPADNHVAQFLKIIFDKERPKRVENIVELLNEVPEYKQAGQDNAGPRVILGNPKRSAGEIFLEMTGGTEGPKEVFDKLSKLGIRTLVSMHLSEEHFKKVRDANLNVVIAGHISSDTLGLNLLLDRIEKSAGEKLTVINCSGFRRISRNNQ